MVCVLEINGHTHSLIQLAMFYLRQTAPKLSWRPFSSTGKVNTLLGSPTWLVGLAFIFGSFRKKATVSWMDTL